jgi:phosphoglycerate dehydrogenase-like enzyme
VQAREIARDISAAPSHSKARAEDTPGVRLLFCGSGWLPIVDLIATRLPPEDTIEIWDRARPLTSVITDADVVLPSNAFLTAEVIAAAARCRLIQQPAAGHDKIDLAAARARDIPVCNAPGANHVAVAEAALFLLLACARRLPAAQAAFARREIGVPLGVELAGKTLGIVGPGRTGTAVAERARALGMTVRTLGRGATPDDRRAFFAAFDAVSIHCPLTEQTRGLVGAEAFAAMKPGAMLINVARGQVIDRAALAAALASGALGGVGLDVVWHEPWDPADPLFRDPRVVVLPHVAGSTEEAFLRIAEIVWDNLGRLRRGEPLAHRIV